MQGERVSTRLYTLPTDVITHALSCAIHCRHSRHSGRNGQSLMHALPPPTLKHAQQQKNGAPSRQNRLRHSPCLSHCPCPCPFPRLCPFPRSRPFPRLCPFSRLHPFPRLCPFPRSYPFPCPHPSPCPRPSPCLVHTCPLSQRTRPGRITPIIPIPPYPSPFIPLLREPLWLLLIIPLTRFQLTHTHHKCKLEIGRIIKNYIIHQVT